MYSGIEGSMVIFVADDPSCWSSAQSEQNTRFYSLMAHIPTLEPSTPQEFKDFTKFAFELSQKFKIPVMIRSTTRASHQSGPVILGKLEVGSSKLEGRFIKDPRRFSTMAPRVLEMKKELLRRLRKLKRSRKVEQDNLWRSGPSIDKVWNCDFGSFFLICNGGIEKIEFEIADFEAGDLFIRCQREKYKSF
jgi:TPP-dependent indolepyruvate ferredoxin oxidoreductase alpha subunit